MSILVGVIGIKVCFFTHFKCLSIFRDYYELAGVEYHNSFTEFKIKPRFDLVDRDASQAIQHLKDFAVEFP